MYYRRRSPIILYMKLIGLTGGVGSGKNIVAKIFSEVGFCVLDFDLLSAEIRDTNKEVQDRLTAAFGNYNRNTLRNSVFRNTGIVSKINEIFFGPLIALAHKRAEESNAPVTVWDTSILLDFPDDLIPKQMEQIFVVHCPREIRKARLMKRHITSTAGANIHTSRVSEGEAELILNVQISDEKRLELARARNATIIYGDTNTEDLQVAVRKIAKELIP